jgi:phosphoribosylformylglycinamidine synthase subunit PurL
VKDSRIESVTRAITPDEISEHGLTPEEFETACRILGRDPNITELGIFSVMWSEHCSYKSSRAFFHLFPTDGPGVIQGPGENAGIIDIGDGWAACFKMESHNHPSFIEPFQGAATGVGGILRDIFTMGARPIANLNSLRFGAPNHPKTEFLVSGVVNGISSYGNCMGIPTVGGEVTFDPSYNGNILVNAFSLGVMKTDAIFLGSASGVGNPVIYVGSKTGKDGIHGATMASEEFGEGSEEKRPTVQKGDPFIEKLLLEACMEVFETDAVVGIQDMGAAGLTCSTFEMASRAGNGVELNLDAIPQREKNMTAYELLLSESQERMLLVAEKGKEQVVIDIFSKWGLDASVCGSVTDTGRAVITWLGEVVADMPAAPLADEAPRYERPHSRPSYLDETQSFEPTNLPDIEDANPLMLELMGHPNLASKRWVFRQYDHMVGADTVIAPGADAAVVRVHGTDKGLAMSSDCNSRWVYLDPYDGAGMALVEAARNLSCVGATPLAITDCLNFGNPEKPGTMWQLVEAMRGLGDACKEMETPVISGNVSLYNETDGQAIHPTPTVGMVGLIEPVEKALAGGFKEAGHQIAILGAPEGKHLGGSTYLNVIHGLTSGRPPKPDFEAERKVQGTVRALIHEGLLTTAHDCSDGGVAVALVDSSMHEGAPGARVTLPGSGRTDERLFGEDGARILVAYKPEDAEAVKAKAASHGTPLTEIGQTGGDRIEIAGLVDLPVAALRNRWETGFEDAVGLS